MTMQRSLQRVTVAIGSGTVVAAIGAAGDKGKDTEAEVTIGTAGATAEQEDVHVTATGLYGSAIGSGIKIPRSPFRAIRPSGWRAEKNSTAIGSNYGNVEVNIKDNVTIDAKDEGHFNPI